MNTEIQINTKEYIHKLEQLHQGIISVDEWREYCDAIRNSIAVDQYIEISSCNSPLCEHK